MPGKKKKLDLGKLKTIVNALEEEKTGIKGIE
jgi:hypothetical protein